MSQMIQYQSAQLLAIPIYPQGDTLMLEKANSGSFLSSDFIASSNISLIFNTGSITKGNNWNILGTIDPAIVDPAILIYVLNTTSVTHLVGMSIFFPGGSNVFEETIPPSPTPTPVLIAIIPVHGVYVRPICTLSTDTQKELTIFVEFVT